MAKRKRHTPEQIIRKLEDADRRLSAGQNISQVCQPLGAVRRENSLKPYTHSPSQKHPTTAHRPNKQTGSRTPTLHI